MSVHLAAIGNAFQFFNTNGRPLAAGLLYTYAAGTTTPQTTYSDNAGAVPNANPIVLGADGRVPNEVWLTDATAYKFVLKTSGGATLGTYDNLIGIGDISALASTTPPIGASLVGFKQTGSSTGRTVQTKLQDFVSVKDFGATGNGVTDDTAAIQAALNASSFVFFPSGTYITSGDLALNSNQVAMGAGQATIIKANAASINVFRMTSQSNVHVRDMLVDGGGQSAGVTAGIHGVTGIRIDGCTFWSIRNVRVRKCGVKNGAAPTTDATFGGFGIAIFAVAGATFAGTIDNCYVESIAGGGNNTGDGIYIGGQNASLAVVTRGISVCNTRVSTVGRNCISVAEGAGTSIPTDISISDCYFEKSALCGIDIESGNDIEMTSVQLSACGNDQTYFDPATSYGATYRLLAGIAIDNSSVDISVNGGHVIGCYYGITWGATNGFTLCDVKVETSTICDVFTGLAASPRNLRVMGCEFASSASLDPFILQNSLPGAVSLTTFAGKVRLSAPDRTVFQTCTFKAGVEFRAAGGGNISFIGCTWTDYAGEGVFHSSTGYSVADVSFVACKFLGAGALTNGISLQFDSALRWLIEGCQFYNLTGSGIVCNNGDGKAVFSCVQGNTFRSCANGFVVSLNGGMNYSVSGNTFEGITGWCIDFSGIAAAGNLNQVTVANNVAGATVTNGLRILTTTGAWDWCLNLGNNWHNASGTKQSLAAGNANGVSANNLIT